jgi:hypothetical protein
MTYNSKICSVMKIIFKLTKQTCLIFRYYVMFNAVASKVNVASSLYSTLQLIN